MVYRDISFENNIIFVGRKTNVSPSHLYTWYSNYYSRAVYLNATHTHTLVWINFALN